LRRVSIFLKVSKDNCLKIPVQNFFSVVLTADRISRSILSGVGGSWGYAELLEIISDPSHPEYEERMEWVGESFNPDTFDLNEVNQRLREFQ
jgi:Plasmid pRiA4b ORF-3-like protein